MLEHVIALRLLLLVKNRDRLRGASQGMPRIFVEAGAPLPILTNGRLQAATHKLVTQDNDILTVAVLWYKDGELEPVNSV